MTTNGYADPQDLLLKQPDYPTLHRDRVAAERILPPPCPASFPAYVDTPICPMVNDVLGQLEEIRYAVSQSARPDFYVVDGLADAIRMLRRAHNDTLIGQLKGGC